MRRLLNRLRQDGRDLCCFCPTFLLSGEMTGEHTLQSLPKVFEHMEPICRLRGPWNGFAGGGGVVSSAISAHQFNFWVG